ncbi:hypothetical protein K2173_007284 [Erythroxylum novogranatense]|uniref:Uncharacterized protein n=1 Tax=Erythroxylum novogranatense TaxID=1862640 RepID=A0AAV8T7S4_9ROSI|nr:hypothetical protein K2173_007284 [Erythroxylum novogranatense]
MGSLMAGWDSPVKDPKSAKYKKNWSFTRGQIDAYWNLKKKTHEEEDHLKPTSRSSSTSNNPDEENEIRIQRLVSTPASKAREGFMGMEEEKLMKKKDVWWTRSNWAFLNEPPVSERSSNTYASQFHVASSNTNATVST